ncbi:MAG: bifunctional nuclease family protein [Propionicimonas sp.]|uniref:bifunctional nuclease family protein n=1 Tax=Propionicimonas sp. TaxID=1955623 RepID=UPI003D0CB2AE
MHELKVVEIRVSTGEAVPLVVLEEVAGLHRLLPIWMSHGGASAIFSATEDPDPERPNIHDLAWRLVESGAEDLEAVRIIAYEDGQFYAELVLGSRCVAARPSDAIAFAMRAGCPIQCVDEVLDEAGIDPADGVPPAEAAGADDEVERFREFLDSVNPDDFTGESGES